jgi:N-acetylglucosamine kinase-like BadF-type ATPase
MPAHSLVHLPAALAQPEAVDGARYLMGIDGGATKTLAAVLDLDTYAFHLAHAGPSNEDAVGLDAAAKVLRGVADEALRRAGIGERELARAVLAVAGTDTGAISGKVHATRGETWIVVNDVVAAWATATGVAPGVGAISGTGSNVLGVGPRGQAWRTGGWGQLLGDEGSGYWLGIESIKAALHERDGSGPATALSAAVIDFFHVPSVEALASLVYAKPLTKREIAAFASRAATVADAGDGVARALYERGAAELARQIGVVIERAGLSREDFPVGLIGSVFKAGALFVEPLAAAVRETAPAARISVVDMPPAGGSLLLAGRACGVRLERAELSRRLDAALALEP